MDKDILYKFLCASNFYSLEDLYDYKKDIEKIENKMPSYDILIFYLLEIMGHCFTVKKFLKERDEKYKKDESLIDKAENYFKAVFELHQEAANDYFDKIQSKFDNHLLDLFDNPKM